MAKYITDIIQDLIDQADTTALDATILEYLETPENGFMDSTSEQVYYNDGTAYVPLDATSYGYITIEGYTDEIVYTTANLTVDQWKALYLEQTKAQANRSVGGVVISDNDSPHYPLRDFDSLVDNITTGGLQYDSGDWIKYEFANTVLLDRLTIYADTTCNIYFAYSENDVDWNYIKAEADHTLTSTNKLVVATSESDAQTNYWTISETGYTQNIAKFPTGKRAKYVKVFILTDGVTIHDLVYTYVDVKDTLAVDYLSAISADVGLLTAGVIQSSNFNDGGVKMDLDNDVIKVYDSLGTLRVELGKLI